MKVSLTVEDDSGHVYTGQVILKPENRARKRTIAKPVHAPAPGAAHPTRVTDALKRLHEAGKFKKEMTLKNVEELAKMECNFPKPTLMMALSRAKFLTRRGKAGSYRWIQKYKGRA